MRLFLPTLFLLASSGSNALNQANTTTAAPKKCYMLDDPKAPFFSPTLKTITGDEVLPMLLLQGIGKQMPELSKCLASSDPIMTLLPVYANEESQTCVKYLMGQGTGSEMMDGSSDTSEKRRLQMEDIEEWVKKLLDMLKLPMKNGSEPMEMGSMDGSMHSMDDLMEKGESLWPMLEKLWPGDMMKGPDGKKGNSSMAEEQKTMFETTLCPLIDSTVMPCVNSLLAPAIQSIMKAGGSCCTDLEKIIKEWMGTDLPTFMKTMSKAMQAAVCSKNAKTGVVCGDAWTTYMYELEKSIRAMDNMKNNRDRSAIEELLQIPNSEVCNVMTGKPFETTTGQECMNKVNSTVDICYEPFDNLMTEVSSLPVIKKMNLTSMFADEECLDTEKMYKKLNMTMKKDSDKDPMSFMEGMMKDLSKKMHNEKPKKMCLHIPNSVDSCTFVGKLSTDDSASGIIDADEIEDASMSAKLTMNVVVVLTTLASMIAVVA